MADGFNSEPISAMTPATVAEAVTPSNSVNLTQGASRALYVGTGGDITAVMFGTGTAVLFPSVPSGALLPIRVTRVNLTGTGASGIVSLR